MKTLFVLVKNGILYFCLATVLAQVVAVSSLAFRGALDRGRLYRVLAALHGMDVVTMHAQLAAQRSATEQEQPSYDARHKAEELKSLDLDLRESAIDMGRDELLSLQAALQSQQVTFLELKQAYDTRLQEMADEEQASSMQELQRTIEAMRPEQAKEQLLKMLDDDGMDDVVTIVKNMAIDKRKKIVAEFKQGSDADQLYQILKNIRLGEPIVSQIQDARNAMNPLSRQP